MDPAKADPRLREALTSEATEQLTVLLHLEPVDGGDGMAYSEPASVDFQSRREKRVAQIAAQQQRAARAFGGTMQALRDLGLHVAGGDLTPIAVVTGSKHQVTQAIALDAVSDATLDSSVRLR